MRMKRHVFIVLGVLLALGSHFVAGGDYSDDTAPELTADANVDTGPNDGDYADDDVAPAPSDMAPPSKSGGPLQTASTPGIDALDQPLAPSEAPKQSEASKGATSKSSPSSASVVDARSGCFVVGLAACLFMLTLL